MDLKEVARNYFTVFSMKDLDSLKRFFSQNIVLRDWETNATGFNNVIEANKILFNTVDSIEVSPINIFLDGKVVIGELEITINRKNRIKVVDIITFGDDSKIISIKAFKG